MFDFNHFIHFVVYQAFPYIVIVVFILGSWLRHLLAPHSWKSQSSKILGGKKELYWGAVLFHIGVILLFFGHLGGLLTPKELLSAVGLTPPVHQLIEIIVGGVCCVLCVIGICLMFLRRASNLRVRKSSRRSDWLTLVLILLVLLMGGASVINAILTDHSGATLVQFGNWAKGLLTFDPYAWTYLLDAPLPQKIHIFIGLLIFFCVPFTRLVHIWSGYASPVYLFRSHQLMRRGGHAMGGDRKVQPDSLARQDIVLERES